VLTGHPLPASSLLGAAGADALATLRLAVKYLAGASGWGGGGWGWGRGACVSQHRQAGLAQGHRRLGQHPCRPSVSRRLRSLP
jgi:hypothetical protein